MKLWWIITAFSLLITLGCSPEHNGQPLDNPHQKGAGEVPPSAGGDATGDDNIEPVLFADVVAEVLDKQQKCTQCHNIPGSDWKNKEDVRKYVVPGDPSKSFIILQITTGVMPPPDKTDKRVSQEELDLLKQWILDGAL